MYKNYIQHYADLNAPANDTKNYERAHERRTHDLCVLVIDGQVYPVHDWSPGGILFEGPARRFALGAAHNVTMKFKLHDRIIDINHSGHILRKSKEKVALQFDPLPADVRKKFETIIRYRGSVEQDETPNSVL